MNYYPRYPAHYVAKTMHLSMEQDGAYTRLLDWCYSNERAVPHAQRYAIARATKPSERRSVDEVLVEFFTHDNGVWSNGRVIDEIDAATPKIEAARLNGKKGGRPRNKKPSGFAENNPMGFQDETQNEPTAKAPQSPVSTNTSLPHTTVATSAIAQDGCVQAAILLNAMGKRITPHNPQLMAAIADGCTPEEIDEMAKVYADKPAGYVIAAVRSQRAGAANVKQISGAIHTPNGRPSALLRGLNDIEELKRGFANEDSDRYGTAKARIAGPAVDIAG